LGKVFAVVVAAGKSTRMGGINKLLLHLDGTPVLIRALQALDRAAGVDGIVLASSPENMAIYREAAKQWQIKKITAVVPGGDNRQQSVYYGLLAVPFDCDIVLVHDGARPLLNDVDVSSIISAAGEYGAATLAVPVKDTVKEAGVDGFVARTPDRKKLWLTLTPQGFSFALLKEAHRQAGESGRMYTDDASMVEACGHRVRLVVGSYSNIKITTAEDVLVAEAILKSNPDGFLGTKFRSQELGARSQKKK